MMMVEAIKIIEFTELNPMGVDGRKFLLRYEFGQLEDSEFHPEFDGKVIVLFSGTLQVKWGESVEPVLTHSVNELKLAVQQNRLSQLKEIKLLSDNVPINLPTKPNVNIGDVIKINDEPLW